MFLLDSWAKEKGTAQLTDLSTEDQAALRARLKETIRVNTYDSQTKTLTISPLRARAFEANAAHYADVFGKGRAEYAIPKGALTSTYRQRAMSAFFFWTAWACATDRPDLAVSYTQNWPHEPQIDNKPTSDALLWSLFTFVLHLAAVGGMVWYFGSLPKDKDEEAEVPTRDPLLGYRATPSQKATFKYFFVVAALFVAQIGLGAVTAHYGVEGSGFYGIPLDQVLPYAVVRTWHTQLGIFWIATAWLATGLFVAPAVGGCEPKGQRFLVTSSSNWSWSSRNASRQPDAIWSNCIPEFPRFESAPLSATVLPVHAAGRSPIFSHCLHRRQILPPGPLCFFSPGCRNDCAIRHTWRMKTVSQPKQDLPLDKRRFRIIQEICPNRFEAYQVASYLLSIMRGSG